MAKKTANLWAVRGVSRELFETPAELWNAALLYFQWCVDNPIYQVETHHHQGKLRQSQTPKPRAMTWEGLAVHSGLNPNSMLTMERRKGFADVFAQIRAVMRDQKLTGAAADTFNASVIIRDLGLAERREVTGADGGPLSVAPSIDLTALSKEELRTLAGIELTQIEDKSE